MDGVGSPCMKNTEEWWTGLVVPVRKIPRHRVAESCSECVTDDSGW